MNYLENTSFLITVIIFLSLVVIFILFLYLRQKKQFAIKEQRFKITEERINLFLATTSDREAMFNELSLAKPESLSNKYLKEKIKSRLIVKSYDVNRFSFVLNLIDNLPKNIRVIIEGLLVEALTNKQSYYLGSLLSRSIIEIPLRRPRNRSRLVLEKIISTCEDDYRKNSLQSAIKYISQYIRRKKNKISESNKNRLINEIKSLKEEIKNII
ncbi:MAG: hypothetical protein PF488_02465 [Patescibacteria group bacterium]|jgi:hypothetical protein|nr:hypothetical protein [Patescibacteria group bacterium]